MSKTASETPVPEAEHHRMDDDGAPPVSEPMPFHLASVEQAEDIRDAA